MNVEKIVDDILRREGGFVDHPNDRGGPTKFGITAAALGDARRLGRSATREEVEALTEDEARAIYRANYIDKPRFNEIRDERLRALMVDCAVHSGVRRAIGWLQGAAIVVTDGVIGAHTIAAANARPQQIYYGVMAERLRYLGRLIANDPKQAVFAAGWLGRCAEFLES